MEISYLGHSSFKIRSREATLVCDPYDSSMVGLKFPKIDADIVTVSHNHNDHNQTKLVGGNPKIVSGPGEYEIKGISIFGIPSFHDKKRGAERGSNTIYTIRMEGINLCHLGDLGEKLSEEQAGEIGSVDILFIPVGGVYTIDQGEAAEIVSVIDPRVVIPMHYKTADAKMTELADVSEFVKSIGLEPQKFDKYVVSQDKLPEERTLVIL